MSEVDSEILLKEISAVADDGSVERAQTAVLAISVEEVVEDESPGVMLLGDIRQVFVDSGESKLSTKTLIALLAEKPTRPWRDYNGPSRSITPHQLAILLGSFGIGSKGIRVGISTPKGYEYCQFVKAFKRYVPIAVPVASVAADISVEEHVVLVSAVTGVACGEEA